LGQVEKVKKFTDLIIFFNNNKKSLFLQEGTFCLLIKNPDINKLFFTIQSFPKESASATNHPNPVPPKKILISKIIHLFFLSFLKAIMLGRKYRYAATAKIKKKIISSMVFSLLNLI